MFRREVKSIHELLAKTLRANGLETPLLQKRLQDNWSTVVGQTIARYTAETFIRNQTLFVKLQNPALRADLSMMRAQLVKRLNDSVGAMIITDIRFY